jgi:hypothetical protein
MAYGKVPDDLALPCSGPPGTMRGNCIVLGDPGVRLSQPVTPIRPDGQKVQYGELRGRGER